MLSLNLLSAPYQLPEALYVINKDVAKNLTSAKAESLHNAIKAANVGLPNDPPITLGIMPEETDTGKRMYYVSTWPSILTAIEARRAKYRPCPYYELYQEKTPVHFFVDIDKVLETEADKAIQDDVWASHLNALVDQMFASLCRHIPQVTCASVYITKAHKEGKRSFHIVMKLQQATIMFRSATVLKRFFFDIMGPLPEDAPLKPDLAPSQEPPNENAALLQEQGAQSSLCPAPVLPSFDNRGARRHSTGQCVHAGHAHHLCGSWCQCLASHCRHWQFKQAHLG